MRAQLAKSAQQEDIIEHLIIITTIMTDNQLILEGLIRAMPQLTERNQLI